MLNLMIHAGAQAVDRDAVATSPSPMGGCWTWWKTRSTAVA